MNTVKSQISRAARSLYESLGWPNTEMEQWRRTDLRRLLPKGILDAAAAETDSIIAAGVDQATKDSAAVLLPENWAARVVTEFGRPVAITLAPFAVDAGLDIRWVEVDEFSKALETAGEAEINNSDDRVIAWHWANITGSLMIRVPQGVEIPGPVVVEERLRLSPESPVSGASLPHLHIESGSSSKVAILWSFEGAAKAGDAAAETHSGSAAETRGGAARVSGGVAGRSAAGAAATPIVNAGLSAVAGENSVLDITLRQGLAKNVVFFLNDYMDVGRDAQLILRESHLGAALMKTRAHARLTAPGAYLSLKGMYLVGEGRHADIGTLQEHKAPNTDSKALYKGAIRPGGRTVFQGLIEVAPGASKTDAYLTNNNLVLGDGARADSLPKLNILTDDVRCSHGSTTGKLDADQMFYLVSRGFSADEATKELTRGFLWEAVDGALPEISDILAADLDAALDLT